MSSYSIFWSRCLSSFVSISDGSRFWIFKRKMRSRRLKFKGSYLTGLRGAYKTKPTGKQEGRLGTTSPAKQPKDFFPAKHAIFVTYSNRMYVSRAKLARSTFRICPQLIHIEWRLRNKKNEPNHFTLGSCLWLGLIFPLHKKAKR